MMRNSVLKEFKDDLDRPTARKKSVEFWRRSILKSKLHGWS